MSAGLGVERGDVAKLPTPNRDGERVSEWDRRRRLKPLRLVVAALVWLVAGLLGVVGLLLSATIVLLPVGIPVLMLARRLFSLSVRLALPPVVTHPVKEMRKRAQNTGARALERGLDALPGPRSRRRSGRVRTSKRLRAQLHDARRRLNLA